MAKNEDRPVRDDGLAPGETTPFYAGQQYQATPATRKAELLYSGSRIGFVPGHGGTRRGSTLRAGGVLEASLPDTSATSFGKSSAGLTRRPMPREVPIHRIPGPGGVGSLVRFLDGHTEHHLDRPGLLEEMNDPDAHPDDREAARMEIEHRDSLNGHRYW